MRSLGHGIKHLLLAVIWLGALVCIAEVALRAQQWYSRGSGATRNGAGPDFETVPSTETYQTLRAFAAVKDEEGRIVLRTNSFGLRGPEIQIPKPAGVFRVICLGDDSTLAAHLHEDETYCARLREYLQRRTQLTVETINAGLPGGCPLTALLFMRHRLLGLQPDLVLQHVDPTDFGDDRLIRPFTYMDEDGVPLAAVHPSCRKMPGKSLLSLSEEFLILDWTRKRLVAEWNAGSADAAETWDSFEWELAAQQTLSPLPVLQSLVGGAYCEVIVTAADDPLHERTAAVAADERTIDQIAAESPETVNDLASYARQHRLAFLDATAALRQEDPGAEPLQLRGPDDHDLYASLQAEFIVAHVPGVWSAPSIPTGATAPLERPAP